MTKWTIGSILKLVEEFQAQHHHFPNARSGVIREGQSWNAIDSAIRRDAIVQCAQLRALKAQLLLSGLTPSLARLNPDYAKPRTGKREFADILAMVNQTVAQHGHFPLRSWPFEVQGYEDSWTAIDSALINCAIVQCPLWTAHLGKLAQWGVAPSLASLNPDYQPLRRQRRTIAAIMAMIVDSMSDNAGKMPNQRTQFPGLTPQDSWKAICKALSSGAVVQDADRLEFYARLEKFGRKASLFALQACYRDELQSAYARAAALEKPVHFQALIAQLYWTPPEPTMVDPASSRSRLNRSLKRSKW